MALALPPGLRSQATLRLMAVMAVASAALAAVSGYNYLTLKERELQHEINSLSAHYTVQLPRVVEQWRVEAEQTRARLEFARILEEPEAVRWAILTAYINAQWEFLGFPHLLLLDEAGEVRFRYGAAASELEAGARHLATGWFLAQQSQDLYRLFVQPIWLGRAGQGRLVLLKPITPSVLASLTVPDADLHLFLHGRRVASTHPATAPSDAAGVPGLVRSAAGTSIQIALPWTPREAEQPMLVVQKRLPESLPLRDYLLPPLLSLLVILLLLWLALVRWLTQTVRRIEALEHGTAAYSRGASAAQVEAALDAARARSDEIRDVALTLGEMMRTVEARQHEQRSHLETLALLEEAVVEVDATGRIVHASPGWSKLVHEDQPLGRPFLDYIEAEDASTLRARCEALREGEPGPATLRCRLRGSSAEHPVWVECRLVARHDAAGQIDGVRGVLRDVTQSYLHEKQINHMALHDALTQLPNRVLLEDRMKIALRLAERTGRKVGVCFIDLDHFKNVNDTLGHKTGDQLLVMFARLLRERLRSGDTLARWGGDEFVLLLPDMESDDAIREVARKVAQAAQSPLPLAHSEYRIGFSMGVALYPDDAGNADALLSQADRALFHAKAQGRNQICFFGDMDDKGGSRRDFEIQSQLASAIQHGRIQAWFQPIIAAASGRCVGVEVLARWHDEALGWISPATFIPMAENLGLIRELGEQIWLASLEAAQAGRARGLDLGLHVNISKRQLFQAAFAQTLLAQVDARALAHDAITFEVTESIALLDVEHAAQRLRELRAAGFHISIDDFGTGFASLSQLHDLPVSELKIDIAFVRRLHDPKGLSMVQAIIQLAKTFNLGIVAEGVEDAATAERLRALGVDFLQGYHFAHPMPRAAFEAWLGAPAGRTATSGVNGNQFCPLFGK